MKAESIEQIREHLAKGGRALAVLKDGRTDEVKRVDMGMLRVYAGIWSSSFACVDVDHWQLLPLEEKEPVPVAMEYDQVCDALKEKRRVQERGYCQTEQPVDHGTQKGQAKDGRDPMPCELNREAYLDLLREDFDWLVEQPRSLEREHIKEVLSWLMKNRPDGTQKVQEEIYVVGPHDGTPEQQAVRQRIRTRLLHGVWPEMSDLLAWWEATTGERIEWGKRCERCKASGRVKRLLPIGYDWITCLDCNGSGYSVRPTWMEEGK